MSSPKKFSKSLTKQQSNNNSFYNISYNTKHFNTDNKVKSQIFDFNKILQTNYNENNYMNRPIINFIPKMPLYNFDKKELINPSKMNYVVPVMPPPSHRVKRTFRGVNYSNPYLKPELNDEIAEFEKGLFTYFRRKKFEKKK
jgi:hypothetical protein